MLLGILAHFSSWSKSLALFKKRKKRIRNFFKELKVTGLIEKELKFSVIAQSTIRSAFSLTISAISSISKEFLFNGKASSKIKIPLKATILLSGTQQRIYSTYYKVTSTIGRKLEVSFPLSTKISRNTFFSSIALSKIKKTMSFGFNAIGTSKNYQKQIDQLKYIKNIRRLSYARETVVK